MAQVHGGVGKGAAAGIARDREVFTRLGVLRIVCRDRASGLTVERTVKVK